MLWTVPVSAGDKMKYKYEKLTNSVSRRFLGGGSILEFNPMSNVSVNVGRAKSSVSLTEKVGVIFSTRGVASEMMASRWKNASISRH